ncbi:MAG: SURF1 family protein [Elsteraceae bacterium]
MNRRLLIPALVTFVAVGGVFSLGVWQIERREWKQELIAARSQALAAPPIAVTRGLTADAVVDLAPAVAVGRFRHDLEMTLVGRAGHNTPGVHIATPLVLRDGGVLLVDRGWVPLTAKDPAKRAAGQIDGEVTVAGLLRRGEQAGWFTPASKPGERQFFFADLPAMAAATGLQGVLPLLLEAGPTQIPGGLPAGGQTRLELSNNHLQYSLTWFTLAAAGLAIFWIWARRQLAANRREEQA